MLAEIAQLLVDVVASFFVYLLLARFHFQWLRVPFRNPIGGFVVALTDWIVRPARRIVPGIAGFDIATLLVAWLLQAFALWVLYSVKGGDAAGAAIGLIAVLALFDLVRYSLYILIFAVLVQVLLSWLNPYSPVAPVFSAITRPFLAPIRRFLPPIANFDLSPLVLLVLLQVVLIPLTHLRNLATGVF
ncbi:MAG: YggT family protein [Burkholderiales bacterium]